MDALQRLIIEQACAKQISCYAAFMDEADYDGAAALFTENARYGRPTDPANPVIGRAAILADFKARPTRVSRHIVSNIVVDVESDTTARAHSRVTLFMGSGDPPATIDRTLVGDFHDRFEKVGEEWLFAERRGGVTLRA